MLILVISQWHGAIVPDTLGPALLPSHCGNCTSLCYPLSILQCSVVVLLW